MLEESWDRIRVRLKTELGHSAFNNWINPLTLLSAEKSVARFLVPTTFMGNWVQRNFSEKIYVSIYSFV